MQDNMFKRYQGLEHDLFHCCCLVAQACPTLCNERVLQLTAARQASLSLTISRSSRKLMSIESVMPSNHLMPCRPLLLLPSIFPSIRVFSNESALRIRWPKYWSFSFNISPSDEYSGLSSLVTNNVEHLMCLLTICMSS